MAGSEEILNSSVGELLAQESETGFLGSVNKGLRNAFNDAHTGSHTSETEVDAFHLEVKGRPDILIPRLYPPIITRCGVILDKGPRLKGIVAVEGLLIPSEHRDVGKLYVVLNTAPTSNNPERYGLKAKVGMIASAAEHLGIEPSRPG
jgi:hypothetical protein